MAIAYQHGISGYFAGAVEDFGLLPNNATRVAPRLVVGYIPRWNGGEWEQVEDHRGKIGYVDGQPHTVTAYGALPEGWSDVAPEQDLKDI